MELTEIKMRLENALLMLYKNDKYLIEKDINERSISHCLAIHLQAEFIGYNVDCEYNKNINDEENDKAIMILKNDLEKYKKTPDGRKHVDFEDEEYYSVSVYPDIIIHKRGDSTSNFLIIEMKKSTSYVDNNYDIKKLENYTKDNFPNNLNYQFGAFIRITTGVRIQNSYKNEIMIYQKGKEIENYSFSILYDQ